MNVFENKGLDVDEPKFSIPTNNDYKIPYYDVEEIDDTFDENSCTKGNKISNLDNLTLNYLTHDAVPLSVFYHNHDNMNRALRPTLEQLHTGVGLDDNNKRSWDPSHEEERQADAPVVKQEKAVFKFGWISGVLVPTMLNIWGVVLFLRIPWIVGQSGVLEASAIVVLSTIVTVLTSMSMSAICTNGEVKRGGAYYMISRVLGPKFGGSIGVVFALANAISVGFYFVGLGEAIQSILARKNITMVSEINDIRIIAFITLFLTFVVTQIGLDWVIKTQNGLLLLIVLGVLDATIGVFYPSPGTNREVLKSQGVMQINLATLKENLFHDYRDNTKFFDVFALFFSGVTGMTAGANLSGDLRDPQKAIPIGTFTAIFLTSFSYLLLCWVVAVSAIRDATGVVGSQSCSTYVNISTGGNLSCINITANSSVKYPYGTINDFNIMEKISLWGPIILAGIIAATLSSGLSSLVSAPKVFQAVCEDNIFPGISIFGKEYGRNKEPRWGYVLAALIGSAFIAIGNIDAIAPITSNFFLMAFALINYSVFVAAISKSPSWRPSYKYYNSWLSLFTFGLCIVLMFLISWWSAVAAIGIVILLYVFVEYRKPKINWGESGNSFTYINAIRAVRHLEPLEDHVKVFRINLMCLSGKPSSRPSMVRIASNFTRHYGLLICGEVKMVSELTVPESPESAWLKSQKVKGFHAIAHNETLRGGVRNLLQNVGLGKLKPNTVFLGFMNKWQEASNEEVEEYFGIIDDSFTLNYGVIILRQQNEVSPVYSTLDNQNAEASNDKKSKIKSIFYTPPKGFIDIWWLNDDGGLTILVPHILSQSHRWKGYEIRVFTPASTEKVEANQIKMANLLKRFRIEFSSVIEFVGINELPKKESINEFKNYRKKEHLNSEGVLDRKTLRLIRLGELLREHSNESSLVVISLPIPKRSIVSPYLYISWLETITTGLKTVMLIRGNQESVLTVYS
ncbi:solute carrier family 12 member 2 [Hydra vulgaris]|uniref:Solute carrier family 12 member 2 n=1 Tax=Hydra vulgaris TaxID=6087 RepID=A0ABM4CX30_HYDVU